MSNPIDRQAALDALRTCYDTNLIVLDNGDELIHYGDAVVAIGELPPAQPGWIPCRTALPKEDGQYIVTVKYEHVDGYEDIYSEHGEWVDGHWDAGYGHCGRVEKVLAWQPLPTPYREGGQS